jgi:glycine dehydrogenase
MKMCFEDRHLGLTESEQGEMLSELNYDSLVKLIEDVVPEDIYAGSGAELNLPEALSEQAALTRLKGIMGENVVMRSMLGQGYYNTVTPPVIQRNIFENPGWYTAYTPYQAEIAQGRLEALLNFQTMVAELTGMDIANASLLDEGTACAEALAMAIQMGDEAQVVMVSRGCFGHVIDVVKTRMQALGVSVLVEDISVDLILNVKPVAVVMGYPDRWGQLSCQRTYVNAVHEVGGVMVVCTDLLALTLYQPPGEMGADICVGNSQRFGVPLGFGGPHAAFIAVKDELKRKLPGRLVGVSKDSQGRVAYRLSLQTREQHIRREKATSNICTAQVLLAVMASMYACYHGPAGLRAIAEGVHACALACATRLKNKGFVIYTDGFFDTVTVAVKDAEVVVHHFLSKGMNIMKVNQGWVQLAFDETFELDEIDGLVELFEREQAAEAKGSTVVYREKELERKSQYLQHEVFLRYHTETEMMRYLHRLEQKDIALNRSMIALGSCTMKLNAAAEMMPLSWPEVSQLHPFAPQDQTRGYVKMLKELEQWLAVCTGFTAVSLQPNAGSQGEYAGLLAIKRYHEARGDGQRKICLIPTSAHGTNPASAVMCQFEVIAVKCDSQGNIDLVDLKEKIEKHQACLGALMVTYPSTHGVFEKGIREVCEWIHAAGGLVYMDGANMNAQVGLTSPNRIGADVCHLNLHKTFCIPHGGGGPGVGPIGVNEKLKPYLPGHSQWGDATGVVCSAPYGSASICTISWMYIAMMGKKLMKSSQLAILNANYISRKLNPYFDTLYKGNKDLVAHECILDFRSFKKVTVEDVAKRLIDFGYHAPTMSWPVTGTLMIEPTESECKAELDRFCEAMIQIYHEIQDVEKGTVEKQESPLAHAPHPAEVLLEANWQRGYTREAAAYPLGWVRENKYWPPVSRIDNVYGDRNLFCSCVTELKV